MSPDLYPINIHTHTWLCVKHPIPKQTGKLKQRLDQWSSRRPKQHSQSPPLCVGVQTATKLQNNTTDVGKDPKL